MTLEILGARTAPLPSATSSHDALKEVAIQLETTFLSEMLKSAGLGNTQGVFAGGEGEDQFSSFLVHEQAEQLARAGGIGLAESIFLALRKQANET